MNKKLLLLSLFILFGALGSISIVYALELDWPTSPGGTGLSDNSDLSELVRYFYEWGIGIGGLVSFFALVMAGFRYLTSAGNPSVMSDAMDQMRSALFGLVLLLGSWVILNTINPQLTSLNLPDFEPDEFAEIEDIFGCDTDEDCPERYECRGDSNPGDDKKEGICFMIPCSYALLYSSTDFGGSNVGTIRPDDWRGEPVQLNAWGFDWDGDPGPTAEPGSVQAFYTRRDGTEWSCGKDACGCTLQLFALQVDWIFWQSCGDKIGDIPAYDSNLLRWIDRPIFCVRLVLPQD